MGRASAQAGDIDVEFVAPNPAAFATGGGADADRAGGHRARAGGEFERPEGRPRWTAAAAGLAVAVLIGGAISATPTDGSNGASSKSPPDTAVTTGLGPAPSVAATTAGGVAGLDPTATHGLRLDPVPDGFLADAAQTGIGATDLGATDAARYDTLRWGEVWATDGATRTTGKWFSLLLRSDITSATYTDAERIHVDQHPGFIRGDADGVLRLAFDFGSATVNRSITISSFGRSADELIALARSISIDDDHPQNADDRPELTRADLFAGHEMIASGATDVDLVDAVVFPAAPRSTSWYRSEPPGDVIALQLFGTYPRGDPLTALAVSDVDGLWAGSVTVAEIDGEQVVVAIGRRAWLDTTITVAGWISGGDPMALITTLSPEATVALLASVRRSNIVEWRAALAGIAVNRMSPNDHVGDLATVASGEFADGTPWSAEAWADDIDFRLEIGGSSIDGRFESFDGADIAIEAAAGGTVVLASDAAGASSILRIVTANGTVETPLRAFGSSTGRVFAASSFDADGRFLVEITTADGSVIDSYRSPGWLASMMAGG